MSQGSKRVPLPIMILSGGKGHTGEAVGRSALAQFREPCAEIIHKTDVRSVKAALAVVEEAAERGAIILHTLVVPRVRDAVIREGERRSVPVLDVLGPAITLLSDHLKADPRNRPGLSYALQKKQFDLFDAVDFTLTHDDGARLRDVDKADVVLVGVSRVCKSVACFYLAYRGIRAANVPLIANIEPPEEIVALDPSKVIGLTMNAHRLQRVREARAERFSRDSLEHYVAPREITVELRHASSLMSEHGWRCIDVSYMSVEEVAKEVIQMIEASIVR